MDTTVEIRYAGVVVGRGALVRDLAAEGAFVGLPEPLPVGTLVTLKIGDVVHEARVTDVVESADASAAGMRLRWAGGAAAAEPTPAAAPAPVPAVERAPMPSVAPAPMPAVERAPIPVVAPAPMAVTAAVSADSGPLPSAGARDDASPPSGAASDALPAPLSLASPGGEQGGGKRRRKRR